MRIGSLNLSNWLKQVAAMSVVDFKPVIMAALNQDRDEIRRGQSSHAFGIRRGLGHVSLH